MINKFFQLCWIISYFTFAPAMAFAQPDNNPDSAPTVSILTEAQLLSIWKQNFSTPQYFAEPDTSGESLPMSPICLGAGEISPPKAKQPVILLKLEKIVIDPPPMNSITPPNYLFFFKATFPDKQHNSYYQNWLRNGGLSISYIGIELYLSSNGQDNQAETGGALQGFNMILYPSAVLNGQTSLTYDYLNSYPATQLGYGGPLTGCE